MKVGTIETTVEEKKPKKQRSSISGGSDNGNKKSGGGGGGGNDDNQAPRDFYGFGQTMPDKSQVVMWVLLIIVFMTFCGLIGAYIFIASTGVNEWKPFRLPIQVWISTLLIIGSSVTYVLAEKKLAADDQPRAKKWLLATTILGAIFIASQLIVWIALVRDGVYLESNPYAGFFYILTVLHAIHVLGGIIGLGAVILKCWERSFSEEFIKKRNNLALVVGWYWHFMGGLWIVILCLLGFFK